MPAAQVPNDTGIHRYLISYGLGGRIGRFGSVHDLACERGERVVVHTDRGIEVGIVLVPPFHLSPHDRHAPAGELLRRLTSEDERVLAALRARQEAIVERCRKAIAEQELPIEIVDAESLLDAKTTILYFVGQASEDLGRLSAELPSDSRERVRFEPLLLPGGVASDDEAVASETVEDGDAEMKGPYERLKYDFRRLWECPVCKRRERTDGSVTFRLCPCTTKGDARSEASQPVPMKMVEDGPRPRFPTRPRWPRLPEEIQAAEARSPVLPQASAVEVPLKPATTPPADLPGPPDDLPPTS